MLWSLVYVECWWDYHAWLLCLELLFLVDCWIWWWYAVHVKLNSAQIFSWLMICFVDWLMLLNSDTSWPGVLVDNVCPCVDDLNDEPWMLNTEGCCKCQTLNGAWSISKPCCCDCLFEFCVMIMLNIYCYFMIYVESCECIAVWSVGIWMIVLKLDNEPTLLLF